MEIEAAVGEVYREHASRILAALVRLFGTRNLELAEDVLQEAEDKPHKAGIRASPRPPVCPARLPARRPSGTS
jgi:predicted RNA polymerase sigma factor